MTCPNCTADVPPHERNCVVCGTDVGPPNVRAAMDSEEAEAMAGRLAQQQEDARQTGRERILTEFHSLVSRSVAVMCAPIGKVSQLVSSDNELYVTFYSAVASGSRIPEQNEWDRLRQPVDSAFFPYYFSNLCFALLSLDGSGSKGYGAVCLTLREVAIAERATTFEENTIEFCKRHKLAIGQRIPAGYRAPWKLRGDHAVAKLGHRVTVGMTPHDFQNLLLSGDSRIDDFIEVHIFGRIHRRAIQSAKVTRPSTREDRILINSIVNKLGEVGATLEVASQGGQSID